MLITAPVIMNDQEFNLLLGNLDRLCATCIAPFTVMLAIADTANLTPQGIIANGTGSLINTGPGQFLVAHPGFQAAMSGQPLGG